MISPLHPVSRAVPMASAANPAAPRAEFAFPPRSRAAAITGAPSGVQMVAASAFRPADQQALALDLGVPERGALLAVPVDPFLHRVDIDERQRVPAGQQRRPPGQLAQQQPVHRLQLPDVPPGV